MDARGSRERQVLVVEDDTAIADAVRRRLQSEGYAVDVVHDGQAAVEAAAARRYDLVVLDVMLPRLDGIEVCRQVQSRLPVPVLMLTARAEETDRLIGLAVGADDYLTKPFSPRELVARVAALLRRVDRATELAASRGAAPGSQVLRVGTLEVDPVSRRVSVDGRPVHLTRTEFDLLVQLVQRPGAVLGRERLLVQVWDWPEDDRSPARLRAGRAVDSHIKALRRKLGPDRIRTVTGVGYAMEVPR
jgi:DNA-binding response OmpR family regulator